MLGIPTFGNYYTLTDPGLTAIGSPSEKPVRKGPVTDAAGYIAYFEVIRTIYGNHIMKYKINIINIVLFRFVIYFYLKMNLIQQSALVKMLNTMKMMIAQRNG